MKYRSGLVAIAAREFEPLVQFYRQLLGQEPVTLLPAKYAEFQIPGIVLGIFQPKTKLPALPHPAAQQMSLCLEVEALDAAIAHLTQLGFPPTTPIITASHGREIYATDPDGNWLILHEAATRCENKG